jgi:hypothetical protein
MDSLSMLAIIQRVCPQDAEAELIDCPANPPSYITSVG